MNLIAWFENFIGVKNIKDFSIQKQPAIPTNLVHADWHNNVTQLLFLEHFLTHRSIATVSANWESLLGESPQLTIARYIKEGLLVPISLESKVARNSTADIKRLLKERGLKFGGNRTTVLRRLMEADADGMSELYKDEPDTEFECSPVISPHIMQYVSNKKLQIEKELHVATYKALAALRNRDFAKASRIIEAHESTQKDN